jgi:hypothetical protein
MFQSIPSESNTPSTYHLAAAGHTAVDRGILPEEGAHPGEVAAGRTDPVEGTDPAEERRIGPDPAEVDHTVHREVEHRTGLGLAEEHHTVPEVERHIDQEEAVDRNPAGVVRHHSHQVRHTGQVGGGSSSHPFGRNCGR